MKLNKRLEVLESEIINEPIVLTMPGGRTETLPWNQACGLLARSICNERTPAIELVAQSISSTEPGGGTSDRPGTSHLEFAVPGDAVSAVIRRLCQLEAQLAPKLIW